MKYYLLLFFIGLAPSFTYAQAKDTTASIGFALNSSLNGELYPIRLVPSVTYLKGNSQFELGFGLHPFIRKDQRIFSGEFNYKYFPNGTVHKFRTYLLARLCYANNLRRTYYPTTYNFLFLNGGYGLEIGPPRGFYMGTNVSIGAFTYSKKSEVLYEFFATKKMFEEFGFNLAFQFNIGYRF